MVIFPSFFPGVVPAVCLYTRHGINITVFKNMTGKDLSYKERWAALSRETGLTPSGLGGNIIGFNVRCDKDDKYLTFGYDLAQDDRAIGVSVVSPIVSMEHALVKQEVIDIDIGKKNASITDEAAFIKAQIKKFCPSGYSDDG